MNTRQNRHFKIILCVFDYLSAISSEKQLNLVLKDGFMCVHIRCEHKIWEIEQVKWVKLCM